MTDTALRGVAYVRSCDLYAFNVEFHTKARTCERPFPDSSSNQLRRSVYTRRMSALLASQERSSKFTAGGSF